MPRGKIVFGESRVIPSECSINTKARFHGRMIDLEIDVRARLRDTPVTVSLTRTATVRLIRDLAKALAAQDSPVSKSPVSAG